MGNDAFWTEWTPAQRAFALFWPIVIVYLIGKLLVEKMWSQSAAIQSFRDRRAKGFRTFIVNSDPTELVNNERIVGGNEKKEQIEKTFREILNLDLEPLRQSLQSEKYNAYTVLCAFVWRSMEIQKEINCMTEVIVEAFETARALDDEYFQTGKPKKDLYGLPFSVKSNFFVKGYDVTCGLAKLLDQPKETTTPFVKFLQNQGAVPFCLTNVPQGLLSYVSSNPLYGTTKNPWDFNRTPGGSSGGEAALLAAGGAAFGIGSDLAGSLRIPAAFCGLVTLKPTQERFYVTDTHGGLPGRGRLGLSFGFYTRTVEEQKYLLQLIIGNEEYREMCPESSKAKLQEINDNNKKPIIGYFEDDGFNPVVPSNKRAVRETIEKLRAQGVKCIEFKMEEIDKEFQPFVVADMLFRNVMPDNGAYMSEMYAGEQYDEYMKLFIRLIRYKQNFLVRTLLQNIVMPVAGLLLSKRLACLGNAHNSGTADVRQNQENTDVFKLKWKKYWKTLGIDALICPSFITPAQTFEYPAQLSTGAFITGLFNLLDVPAGVVPVSHVSNEDVEKLNSEFNTEGDVLLKKQRESVKNSVGLPSCVQIVTLPNEEEMCLKVMRMVEKNASGEVKRLQWGEEVSTSSDTTSEASEKTSLVEKTSEGKKSSEMLFKRVPLIV